MAKREIMSPQLRMYDSRLNDADYIAYLEELIVMLKEDLQEAEDKFDNYKKEQHEGTMSEMGKMLSLAANLTKDAD
jgi:hypothetical protein